MSTERVKPAGLFFFFRWCSFHHLASFDPPVLQMPAPPALLEVWEEMPKLVKLFLLSCQGNSIVQKKEASFFLSQFLWVKKTPTLEMTWPTASTLSIVCLSAPSLKLSSVQTDHPDLAGSADILHVSPFVHAKADGLVSFRIRCCVVCVLRSPGE